MNVPLPAGWSAKYDLSQRRYYFINHLTKTTTWEDPRLSSQMTGGGDSPAADPKLVQKIDDNFPFIPLQEIQRIVLKCHNNESAVYAEIFKKADPRLRQKLKSEFPSTKQQKIDEVLVKCNNVESDAVVLLLSFGYERVNVNKQPAKRPSQSRTTDPDTATHAYHKKPDPLLVSVNSHNSEQQEHEDDDKVKELMETFPTATEAYIRRLLQNNKGTMSLVTSEIERDGYKRGSDAVTANPFLVNRLKGDFVNISEDMIAKVLKQCGNVEADARTQLKSMTNKPLTATSKNTAGAAISDVDKNKLLNDLSVMFPGVSKMVVEMILETVEYKEDNAFGLLRTMGGPEVKDTKRSVNSRPSVSSASSTPKKGSKTTTPKKSTQSVTTPNTQVTSPTKTRVTDTQKNQMAELLSSDFPTYSMTALEAALETCEFDEERTRNLLQRDSSMTSRQSKSPSPPKQSTSDQPPDSGNTSTKVQSPPASPVKKVKYMVTTSTIAKGPNPEIVMGPDASNLLKEYVQARGPNNEIRRGPNPDNVHWSMKSHSHSRPNWGVRWATEITSN